MFHLGTSTLTQLLATYGYLAVLLFVAIESTGIPFPGETILLVAAIAAGKTHHLSIAWVIVAGALGAILGDNLGFWVGREGGYRLLRRYGRYIHLEERRLKLGQYLFLKHGGKVVFFGRFVAVLRAWAAFLASTNRMRWPRFLLFNAAGGLVWATLYGLGRYFLGNNIHRLVGPVGIVFLVLAVLLIITGSSSYAATNNAWRTRRNGPCPAYWTSRSREENVQGNPAAPGQECEATGKQDATFWWLTSPGTPAILRGVRYAVGGSTLLGGSGAGRKTPDAPCNVILGRITHWRTKALENSTS